MNFFFEYLLTLIFHTCHSRPFFSDNVGYEISEDFQRDKSPRPPDFVSDALQFAIK